MDRTVSRRKTNMRIIANAALCAKTTMRQALQGLLSQELRLGTITREDFEQLHKFVMNAHEQLDEMHFIASHHANVAQRLLDEESAREADDNQFNSMQS